MSMSKVVAKRLSTALAELVAEKYDGSVRAAARAMGISDSGLNFYTRPGGTRSRFPTPTMISKVLKNLDDSWKRKITAAYLADLIPPEATGLIKISGVKEAAAPKHSLPAPVEEVLDQFRERAAASNDVRNWLLATGRALLGK